MQRGLSKLPFWFWLLFSIAVAYVAYNPFFSISNLMALDVFWGVKVLVGALFGGVVLLYLTEATKTFKPMGLLVLATILGSTIAILLQYNLLSLSTIGWWVQIPTGVTMAIALRWSGFRRAVTNRFAVQDDTAEHHHG